MIDHCWPKLCQFDHISDYIDLMFAAIQLENTFLMSTCFAKKTTMLNKIFEYAVLKKDSQIRSVSTNYHGENSITLFLFIHGETLILDQKLKENIKIVQRKSYSST